MRTFKVIVSTTRTFSKEIRVLALDVDDAGEYAVRVARNEDPRFEPPAGWSEDDYAIDAQYEAVETEEA